MRAPDTLPYGDELAGTPLQDGFSIDFGGRLRCPSPSDNLPRDLRIQDASFCGLGIFCHAGQCMTTCNGIMQHERELQGLSSVHCPASQAVGLL